MFNVRKQIEKLVDQNKTDAIDQALEGSEYYYRDVASDRVVDAIRSEIKLSNTDLLIMIPYKYGFWDSLIHQSKTRMMASGNDIPLLSITLKD